jgi:hypothetical protein
MSTPEGWKNYEDFAAGIDTNRLPSTAVLAGRTFALHFQHQELRLQFASGTSLEWSQGAESGIDAYEAIEVAAGTYFIDIAFRTRPREALTLIVNTTSLRALLVRCVVAGEPVAGRPLVDQTFDVGVLGSDRASPTGVQPAPTRDLIGMRTFQRYSPRHLYEHVYLSSQRYCWQCLVGEQRGHGDVDLATYYKFDDQQYVFTFREFLIPVASVFFFNMRDLRSTGKFLGLTRDGVAENTKAGAYIRPASMTYYEAGAEPV